MTEQIASLAPSNVVNLPDATRIAFARRVERRISAEMSGDTPVANPAHVQLLPFRKTVHGRHSNPQCVADSSADRDCYLGFARRLREVRISLGITEEEAAAAAGRSVTTWRKYETTGRVRCTYAIGRFAEHFDISLDDLFCPEFEPVPEPSAAPAVVLSETGRNERLRSARYDVWRAAEVKLKYCQAWRDLHFYIRRAFDRGVIDQVDCPDSLLRMNDFEQPWILDNDLLNNVMVAERELLLTPAPTVAALDWKRKRAKHQWYRLQDGSLEDEIVRAIDADKTWLDAHPARQCRSNSERGRADK